MNSTKSKVCPELDELQMNDDGKYTLCWPSSSNQNCKRLSFRSMKLHCTSHILLTWRNWRWCNTQNNEEKKREGTKVVSILLFSWITKAIEFISSQSTCHLIGLNELGKNQKFALNLLNQLTTKSWEWHPQQDLGNDTQNSKEKRRERGEGCPDFTFSYTTKAFEFISS